MKAVVTGIKASKLIRKRKNPTASIEWLDGRGRVLVPSQFSLFAGRPLVIRRRLGIRNVGGRELRGLVLKSREAPLPVTRATFRRSGRYLPSLPLGNLARGESVFFWLREETTGIEGPSSMIFAAES